MHCGYLKEEGDKMEHLERHGFLRRGIVRHARLSLQLRNQSARPLAQAPSWRRHSSPPCHPGWAPSSGLRAPGSRLQAPGSWLHYVRYVSSAPPRPPGPGSTGSGLLAVPRTPDEPLGHGGPDGRLRCGPGPRTTSPTLWRSTPRSSASCTTARSRFASDASAIPRSW